EEQQFLTDPNAQQTMSMIIEGLRGLRDKHPTLEGIGVSLPGLVNPESGTASFIPSFRWRDLAVGQELEQATGLAVKVDNDANAVALAELWFGRPEIREVRDFIMVLVEEGLGTGIVFDGQIYHGVGGAAGEFGHMTIGKGAPVACAAGSYECWEAFASERAASARYARLAPKSNGAFICFREIVDRALEGQSHARTALLETARYLGLGISNLLKGLSPEAIIVGGDISRAWSIIADEVIEAVEKNSLCQEISSTKIIASSLGADPRVMG